MGNKTEQTFDKSHVRKAFERAASSYDEAAVLQNEVGQRLLSRLDLIRCQPKKILDLGAGTGKISAQLLKRYPKSHIFAADLAFDMLQQAKKRGSWRRKPSVFCADAKNLPCQDNSFDLVISNLMLQWCSPIRDYLQEIHRVMPADGLIMFSTFGPDTLKELRQAWQAVDNDVHVHNFLDMHDVGDALMQTGFAGVVMDMEIITLTYHDMLGMMRDLKAIGANNAATSRRKGLAGRRVLTQLGQAFEIFRNAEGLLPATYEIVYGHAWAQNQPIAQKVPGKVIPVKVVR